MTRQPQFRLRDLLRVRAYLLKEDLQQLSEYESPSRAGRFLDEWCCPGHALAYSADEEDRKDATLA